MLAREYSDDVKITHKPIIISHHMLKSLVKGVEKMSKSIPDSAIFMEDPLKKLKEKLKKLIALKRMLKIIQYLTILNI